MEVEMGSVNTHALTNHIVSTRVLYHLTHQQYHQTVQYWFFYGSNVERLSFTAVIILWDVHKL